MNKQGKKVGRGKLSAMEKLIVVGDCRNGCDNKKGGEKQNSTLSFLENSALFLLILSSY